MMFYSFNDTGSMRITPDEWRLLREIHTDISDYYNDKRLGPGLARKYFMGSDLDNLALAAFHTYLKPKDSSHHMNSIKIEETDHNKPVLEKFNNEKLYDAYLEMTKENRSKPTMFWF